MEQKTERIYPSAPLDKNIGLEQTFEKILNDENCLNNSVNNIKKRLFNSKTETINQKKNLKKLKH